MAKTAKPRVTLRDIADASGCSIDTVSKVLSGQRKETWPSMVRRANEIRRIAEDLGYQPNAAARATRSGRFRSIGLVLSTDRGRSRLPDALLDGLLDALGEAGMSMTVAKWSDEELSNGRQTPKLLNEWMVDGLLVNYTHQVSEPMVRSVREQARPAVWLNIDFERDCVRPDDFGGGRAATEHLLRLGHRRIAYADFGRGTHDIDEAHYSVRHREQGYRAAMRDAGLEPWVERPKFGLSGSERPAAYTELFRRPDRPTALIGYAPTTNLALRAWNCGLRIPDDLSMLGFGDALVDPLGRPLSQMRFDQSELGHRAVAMMLRMLGGEGESQPAELLAYQRVGEGSTAPPPGRH